MSYTWGYQLHVDSFIAIIEVVRQPFEIFYARITILCILFTIFTCHLAFFCIAGFQAMTQDALTVLNDIPFSIPPYFALLARAIVTLEGIALIGNPNYGIITEAYPFVARKLLSEDRPEIQKALYAVLYNQDNDGVHSEGGTLRTNRLAVLLNSALGGPYIVHNNDDNDPVIYN